MATSLHYPKHQSLNPVQFVDDVPILQPEHEIPLPQKFLIPLVVTLRGVAIVMFHAVALDNEAVPDHQVD